MALSATYAGGSSPSAIGLSAEAIGDGIARPPSLPRALIEANQRTGSALLDFAGQRLHAETEFLERLFDCHDFEHASALHAHFVAAMIGEGGRELTELMAVARKNVIQIADAAGPALIVRSA
jgi:hypothetical protein